MLSTFDSTNEIWTEFATATAASNGFLAIMTTMSNFTAAERKMASGIFQFAADNSHLKKEDCLWLTEKFKVILLQRGSGASD